MVSLKPAVLGEIDREFRILDHPPPRVDRMVDRFLPAPKPGTDFYKPRRVLRDLVHFGVSVANEGVCMLTAAPGFLGEMIRQGPYPKAMSFRKIPYRSEMSHLAVLRESNPGWVFRQDFDPKKWVFVFLHGYVDNTGGDRIAFKLASLGYQVYLVRYPFLESVRDLAGDLYRTLRDIAELEPGKRVVPIGHSLGGYIWDHLLLHEPSIAERYEMPLYLPLGSPHFGTLAAHIGIGKSARDMQPKSDVVEDHLRLEFPRALEVYPFVSRFDLLVLPIETALLKRGINYILSETGHVAQVIRSATVTAIEEIIASPPNVLLERAERRPFYPSILASGLSLLPKVLQRTAGLEGLIQYLTGDDTEAPEFHIRVVHHELGMGIFPALRRPR